MGSFLDWLIQIHAAHPELRLDLLVRLALAAVLGGAIGWERQHAHKPAGLRTNILICVGATLLTDISIHMASLGGATADPGRISAQIVTGVGFLGAGTIMQARGSVSGLTTAATMWVVAAIGMAVGSGATVEAVGTAVLVLIALIPLGVLERRAARHARERELRAAVPPPSGERADPGSREV